MAFKVKLPFSSGNSPFPWTLLEVTILSAEQDKDGGMIYQIKLKVGMIGGE